MSCRSRRGPQGLAEHRDVLHHVQPSQGRSYARAGRHASRSRPEAAAAVAGVAHHDRSSQDPGELARLSVLERRARRRLGRRFLSADDFDALVGASPRRASALAPWQTWFLESLQFVRESRLTAVASPSTADAFEPQTAFASPSVAPTRQSSSPRRPRSPFRRLSGRRAAAPPFASTRPLARRHFSISAN